MKLYLFLRSLVWTAILSVVFIIATLVAAFIAPDLAPSLGLVALAFAVLSPRREN